MISISTVRRGNAGTYNCVATNSVGTSLPWRYCIAGQILLEPGYLGINIMSNIIRKVELHSSPRLPSSTWNNRLIKLIEQIVFTLSEWLSQVDPSSHSRPRHHRSCCWYSYFESQQWERSHLSPSWESCCSSGSGTWTTTSVIISKAGSFFQPVFRLQ